jgi:2-aminoethylphosphonate-pyruvate transaminase
MIKTAVILAAGLGSRLEKIWQDYPKGFIEINGRSLIERSILNLRKYGIEKIIIGTGHKSDSYQELTRKYPFIITNFSPRYKETSSFETLYKMKDILNEDFILLESDLLYQDSAIEFIQKSSLDSFILSTPLSYIGDEVYLEVDQEQNLSNLSKDILKLSTPSSVLVGISKVSINFWKTLLGAGENILSHNPKIDYEHAFLEVKKLSTIKVQIINDFHWCEIDTPDHYEYAIKNVMPYLKE